MFRRPWTESLYIICTEVLLFDLKFMISLQKKYVRQPPNVATTPNEELQTEKTTSSVNCIQSAMILVQVYWWLKWSELKQTEKFCKTIFYFQLQWKHIVCFITLFLGSINGSYLWVFKDCSLPLSSLHPKQTGFESKWQSFCCKPFESCQFME